MIRVCAMEDVPRGEGRRVVIDGRALAIFHTSDGWYALDGSCPHRAGPLADGIVADRSVICPLHERRFDLATGSEIGGEQCVSSYPVEVSGGDVYVRLGLGETHGMRTTPTGMAALASTSVAGA